MNCLPGRTVEEAGLHGCSLAGRRSPVQEADHTGVDQEVWERRGCEQALRKETVQEERRRETVGREGRRTATAVQEELRKARGLEEDHRRAIVQEGHRRETAVREERRMGTVQEEGHLGRREVVDQAAEGLDPEAEDLDREEVAVQLERLLRSKSQIRPSCQSGRSGRSAEQRPWACRRR